MGRQGYEQTKIGRSYGALHEWWERENVRGIWNSQGALWEAHPSWATVEDRDRWHRNWGELLNYHTTAHIRPVMTNGVTRLRLRVRVTHPDRARLELVKSVTGGTIEAPSGPRTVSRLEITTLAAFLALKAGRLFVDPANVALFDVLDAAMDFYRYVPDQAQAATEEQTAAQEVTMERLNVLSGAYVGAGRAPHDCQEGIQHAGMADWSVPARDPNPDDRYF